MRERLALLNGDLEPEYGVRLEARIGVNTGEVVAGEAVAGERLATGDAVNVAARLHQQERGAFALRPVRSKNPRLPPADCGQDIPELRNCFAAEGGLPDEPAEAMGC